MHKVSTEAFAYLKNSDISHNDALCLIERKKRSIYAKSFLKIFVKK